MTTVYSGTGDPARSLALLWRTRERASRPGKPDLSVDRIVAVAIEIADAEGLAAVSMRKVAERLGVGTMSLYTYVPGKAELLDVMVDQVHGEASVPDGPHWRDRLAGIARENWALHRRHPWLLHIALSRPVLGPNVTAKYDAELRAIDGIGLTDLEMDAVLTLVLGFVHGVARGALDAAQAERATGMTDAQWWQAHAGVLGRVADYERFPVASRVGQATGEALQAAYDPDRAFTFGLERVLDGIEALITSRTAGDPGRSVI